MSCFQGFHWLCVVSENIHGAADIPGECWSGLSSSLRSIIAWSVKYLTSGHIWLDCFINVVVSFSMNLSSGSTNLRSEMLSTAAAHFRSNSVSFSTGGISLRNQESLQIAKALKRNVSSWRKEVFGSTTTLVTPLSLALGSSVFKIFALIGSSLTLVPVTYLFHDVIPFDMSGSIVAILAEVKEQRSPVGGWDTQTVPERKEIS